MHGKSNREKGKERNERKEKEKGTEGRKKVIEILT